MSAAASNSAEMPGPDDRERSDAGEFPDHDARILYRDTFEFAPDAQLLTDGAGVILAANNAACVLFRCPKEFLIGKPLPLFAWDRHRRRFYESLWRMGAGAAPDAFEGRIGRKLGLTRDVSVVIRPSAENRSEGSHGSKFHWFIRDITALKQAEADRRELASRLAETQENERRQFSRDLHDSLGQTLTALSLGLRSLRPAVTSDQAGRLSELEDLVEGMGRQLHELVMRVRPVALDDLGLDAALRQLIGEWGRRSGIPVHYHAPLGEQARLPRDIETTLYRVVQEALTNIARHAGKCDVSVVLERLQDVVVVMVEDNGAGFDPESVSKDGFHLGLMGMRERVALIGGIFEVESRPWAGTAVIVRIPTASGCSRHDV